MPVLTVKELIEELRILPASMEVMLEVKGEETWAKGVSLENGGTSAWVTISDYPDTREV